MDETVSELLKVFLVSALSKCLSFFPLGPPINGLFPKTISKLVDRQTTGSGSSNTDFQPS